jgi:hypothetical protein
MRKVDFKSQYRLSSLAYNFRVKKDRDPQPQLKTPDVDILNSCIRITCDVWILGVTCTSTTVLLYQYSEYRYWRSTVCDTCSLQFAV